MRKKRIIIAVFAPLMLTAAWFAAVDWSWFVEYCPDCHCSRDLAQYRIIGIPIHVESREDKTMIQRVCEDLGSPCTHPNMDRWHKHRFWGLCICAAPCINGMVSVMGDDSSYDQAASDRVHALAQEQPGLADEFRQKVLVEQDWDYWRDFQHQISLNELIDLNLNVDQPLEEDGAIGNTESAPIATPN